MGNLTTRNTVNAFQRSETFVVAFFHILPFSSDFMFSQKIAKTTISFRLTMKKSLTRPSMKCFWVSINLSIHFVAKLCTQQKGDNEQMRKIAKKKHVFGFWPAVNRNELAKCSSNHRLENTTTLLTHNKSTLKYFFEQVAAFKTSIWKHRTNWKVHTKHSLTHTRCAVAVALHICTNNIYNNNISV